MSLHTGLRDWLVKTGKRQEWPVGEHYYKATLGDSQGLAISLRKRRLLYNFDALWEHDGEYYVFEMAFTEGWRAAIGEVILAAFAEVNIVKIFIITKPGIDLRLNPMLSILDEYLTEKREGERMVRWGVTHIPVSLKLRDAKKQIYKHLQRGDYVWERFSE